MLVNKKYSVLLKNTLIFSLGSLGSKLILFLLVPLYTNYLTADEYGIADLVFTVAQFIIPIISVVIFDGVVRFGLSKSVHKEDVLRIGYIIIAVDCIIAFLLIPVINLYTPLAKWRWYLSIYSVVCIVDAIQFNYLKVCDKNTFFAGMSVFKTFCMAMLNVLFLVFFQIGIKGYLLANIFALLITNILVFVGGKYAYELKKSHWNSMLFKEMVGYSSPLVFNNISWWFMQSADKVLIEYMLTATALGLYTVAAKIPALINVVISIFSQAWGISSVTEYENTNDTSFYSNVQKTYVAIVCAACIVYVGVIKVFMQYYVGEAYQSAWQYVPLLFVSAVFSAISAFYGSLYGALKKSVNNMFSTFFSAIINIVVAIIFIPKFGLWGAVIATVLAYFFIAIYRMLDVGRFIRLKIEWCCLGVNCTIIITQAILVSVDYYGIEASCLAGIVYLANNHAILSKAYKMAKNKKA